MSIEDRILAMKKMKFVSTGRCGTLRLYEILRDHLPDNFSVVHQMKLSRLGNVIGNLLYYHVGGEKFKYRLYKRITGQYDTRKFFISTDPLTAMLVPINYIRSPDISIIHVTREDDEFARSIYKLSRSRIRSLIAHNLIPLWQPSILPFENILSRRITKKYREVNILKNIYFENQYSCNPYYHQLKMEDLFLPEQIDKLIKCFFGYGMHISKSELRKKSNATRR